MQARYQAALRNPRRGPAHRSKPVGGGVERVQRDEKRDSPDETRTRNHSVGIGNQRSAARGEPPPQQVIALSVGTK